MNAGKQFEQDFKNSIPEGIFFYRLRDGTGNFSGGKNENVRFQESNMCDCILFDGRLYLLELKSHTGKSLPFTAIRENQIKELSRAATYQGVIAGLVINFRDISKTFFIKIDNILYFMAHEERKSIPVSWCEQWGTEIKGRKLRAHYRWDLKEWMEGLK